MIEEIQSKALSGKSAHLSARRALEGLKLDVTGKKILNTPYTIWQLLKHINYWQDKWMERLAGKEVIEDDTWKKGWEDQLNASTEDELEAEITHLLESIKEVKSLLERGEQRSIVGNELYDHQHDVIQAMASHLSYHLGELVLLRRIFGNWPPPAGGYVW